jgi:RNA polymerase sigma-70 factor (ECF subfamily)
MGKTHSDEELMLSYRDGDAGAFETLYQRHKGGLYRYLLRKCSNESTAEELFQDVWMKLIGARERYEVKAKFTTYLYQLANNRCIDHYRRQKTMNPGKQTHEDNEVDNIPGRAQEQPENQVEIHQQTNKLLALFNELPEEQQEAFILREEAGMSIAEIAETTGVNAETAKSRLRYAVNKLRVGMSKNGE